MEQRRPKDINTEAKTPLRAEQEVWSRGRRPWKDNGMKGPIHWGDRSLCTRVFHR